MIFQNKEAEFLSEDVGEHQWLEQFGESWSSNLKVYLVLLYMLPFFPS